MVEAERISESWLASVGFKWHQLDRQPTKHWVLWLGAVLHGGMFASFDDLGIELSSSAGESNWSCWLRSDCARRYSRFIHVRRLHSQKELVSLIEGLTGVHWDSNNNLYGGMRTPEQAERVRKEDERLDRVWLRQGSKWYEAEKDDTRGGALPEHLEALIGKQK